MKASTAMPLFLYRNNRARVYDRESRSASLCDIADQQHDKADMEGVETSKVEHPRFRSNARDTAIRAPSADQEIYRVAPTSRSTDAR